MAILTWQTCSVAHLDSIALGLWRACVQWNTNQDKSACSSKLKWHGCLKKCVFISYLLLSTLLVRFTVEFSVGGTLLEQWFLTTFLNFCNTAHFACLLNQTHLIHGTYFQLMQYVQPPDDATPPTTNKAYKIPKITIFFKTLACKILQHDNINNSKIRNGL